MNRLNVRYYTPVELNNLSLQGYRLVKDQSVYSPSSNTIWSGLIT